MCMDLLPGRENSVAGVRPACRASSTDRVLAGGGPGCEAANFGAHPAQDLCVRAAGCVPELCLYRCGPCTPAAWNSPPAAALRPQGGPAPPSVRSTLAGAVLAISLAEPSAAARRSRQAPGSAARRMLHWGLVLIAAWCSQAMFGSLLVELEQLTMAVQGQSGTIMLCQGQAQQTLVTPQRTLLLQAGTALPFMCLMYPGARCSARGLRSCRRCCAACVSPAQLCSGSRLATCATAALACSHRTRSGGLQGCRQGAGPGQPGGLACACRLCLDHSASWRAVRGAWRSSARRSWAASLRWATRSTAAASTLLAGSFSHCSLSASFCTCALQSVQPPAR